MEKFAFENLDIYQRAVNVVISIRKICKKSKTDFNILNQLKRAALSVALNSAEGSGRFHKRDKSRAFFRDFSFSSEKNSLTDRFKHTILLMRLLSRCE
ncbi:four helix bundle protein [candidate division KSB1 bacterium]|nr:four helix bundle protein [candidate division KSB1 bacterium]